MVISNPHTSAKIQLDSPSIAIQVSPFCSSSSIPLHSSQKFLYSQMTLYLYRQQEALSDDYLRLLYSAEHPCHLKQQVQPTVMASQQIMPGQCNKTSLQFTSPVKTVLQRVSPHLPSFPSPESLFSLCYIQSIKLSGSIVTKTKVWSPVKYPELGYLQVRVYNRQMINQPHEDRGGGLNELSP